MLLKRYILLLLSVCCTYFSFAQSDLTQSRILILLDESSSMIQPWAGGMEKYKAADSLILRLMDSVYAVNPDVEFSLRVFGHQHTVAEDNCTDTRNEVPFSKDNRQQMAFRLDDIRPLGVTPIAYSLEQAAEYDLTDETRNAYSIILITDGGESCGGDICDVMQKLIARKVYFKPYIVSLENDPALHTTYSCMGNYLQVTAKKDMAPAVSTIVAAFRPALRITKSDYKELQTIAASVPSVLKVNIPMVVNKMDTEAPVKQPREVTDLHPVKTFPDTVVPPPVLVSKPTEPQAKKPDTIAVPLRVEQPEPVEKLGALPATNARSFSTQPVTPIIAKMVIPPGLPAVATETAAPKTVTEPVKKLASLAAAPLLSFNTMPTTLLRAKTVIPPGLPPVMADTVVPPPVKEHHIVVSDAPKPEPVKKLVKLIPAPVQSFNTPPALAAKAKIVGVSATLPPVVTDSEVTPPHVLAKLKPAHMRPFNMLWVTEDNIFNQRRVPPLPPVKYDDLVQRVDSKIPIPRKAPVPPGKRGGYTVETEDAKETSLAVYFTDGMGKFYPSTPQMIVVEPISNKIVKRFYRTVDANGEPDPQTDIPEGTFDIAVSSSRSLIIHDVDIVKNKKNKLIIKIKKSSIRFVYKDAPGRPVREFMAVVTERDKPNGKVVNQKCTEELMYDPGNYHIEINTFPRDVRNTDLDLDEETTIAILQPGFAKFTSADPAAKTATLYLKDGDKFLPFSSIDINDPRSQHLQIQPGEYQAHYHTGPGRAMSSTEKVVRFVITATQETEVILK